MIVRHGQKLRRSNRSRLRLPLLFLKNGACPRRPQMCWQHLLLSPFVFSLCINPHTLVSLQKQIDLCVLYNRKLVSVNSIWINSAFAIYNILVIPAYCKFLLRRIRWQLQQWEKLKYIFWNFYNLQQNVKSLTIFTQFCIEAALSSYKCQKQMRWKFNLFLWARRNWKDWTWFMFISKTAGGFCFISSSRRENLISRFTKILFKYASNRTIEKEISNPQRFCDLLYCMNRAICHGRNNFSHYRTKVALWTKPFCLWIFLLLKFYGSMKSLHQWSVDPWIDQSAYCIVILFHAKSDSTVHLRHFNMKPW